MYRSAKGEHLAVIKERVRPNIVAQLSGTHGRSSLYHGPICLTTGSKPRMIRPL